MEFEEFQEFRKILCVCPECGEIVRVSDLRLKSKVKVKKTWLDDYEKRSLQMDRKEEEFYEIESKLREAAVEKGRKKAQKLFNKAIKTDLRKLKLDPYDIKPILNPVDFLVFKDMNSKDIISNIVFLSKTIENKNINLLRAQVKKAIENKNYEWQVARIDNTTGQIELE
jgi:predicted Holliday junction resolvase-like endonuclease